MMMGAEASAAKLMACHRGIHFACHWRAVGGGRRGCFHPCWHVCMSVCVCHEKKKSIILGRSWRSWQPKSWKAAKGKRQTTKARAQIATHTHTHTSKHTLAHSYYHILALTYILAYPVSRKTCVKQWNFSTSCICSLSWPSSNICPNFPEVFSNSVFGINFEANI